MLKNRILSTLHFFDLQGYPLTLLELHRFLIAEVGVLKTHLNMEWELGHAELPPSKKFSTDEILKCLDSECKEEVENLHGFYFLKGRKEIAINRLGNYLFGIKREKLIKKYLGFARFIPFIRGVAVGGSQAMGQEKSTSDIDLLVFTEKEHLWIARTLITFYFQITGHRRHGKYISNRFCLNHYMAGPVYVNYGHDAYNAMEYLRLRPLVYPQTTGEFVENNSNWVLCFFPNADLSEPEPVRASRVQRIFEGLLKNSFGDWIEKKLQQWQLKRIKRGEFVVAEAEEISFHSKQRKLDFLTAFFKHEQNENREAEQAVV